MLYSRQKFDPVNPGSNFNFQPYVPNYSLELNIPRSILAMDPHQVVVEDLHRSLVYNEAKAWQGVLGVQRFF